MMRKLTLARPDRIATELKALSMLSFREWGRRCGVHYTTLQAATSGRRAPSLARLLVMARAAGCTLTVAVEKRPRKGRKSAPEATATTPEPDRAA